MVDLFDGLCGLIVAKRKHSGATNVVSFGPTAAAKTLFALRPHVFVPWDVAMRDRLGHDGSGRSYAAYLRAVRHALSDIEKQCTPRNITLDELPARLGRERSTAAQLIDEYHWITITRGVEPPEAGILCKWLAWS